MSGEWEALLGRVRKALPDGKRPGPVKRDFARLLPAVAGGFEGQVAQFAKNAADLSAVFIRCDSFDSAVARLRSIAGEQGWKRVAFHGAGPASKAALALGIESFSVDGGYEKSALEACDAGITTCEALIAQTGSVLVTSRETGGRGLSILPHHHVVLADKSQMLPDMPSAFDLLEGKYGGNYPSSISFITGPSRTADIEQTLVLGAHGPKKLTILLH